MPFTLSHAAAVLPVLRRDGRARGRLVASALVAGSFAPDLPYYAGTVLSGAVALGEITHSPYGVLTVDVLLTGLLVGAWLLLREPLAALFPGTWRDRAYELLRGTPWRGRPVLPLVLWFWLSAALGSGTHILLDAFTHLDQWGVRLLPVLAGFLAGFPLYYYVQYGGSAVALPALGAYLIPAVRRMPDPVAEPGPVPRLTAGERLLSWLLLGSCALAGAVHRCLRQHAATGWDYNLVNYTPVALFGAGAGLTAGLVLHAVLVRIRHGSGSGARQSAPERPPVPAREPAAAGSLTDRTSGTGRTNGTGVAGSTGSPDGASGAGSSGPRRTGS